MTGKSQIRRPKSEGRSSKFNNELCRGRLFLVWLEGYDA